MASTSRSRISPSGPVPATDSRATPSSPARLRAAGVAHEAATAGWRGSAAGLRAGGLRWRRPAWRGRHCRGWCTGGRFLILCSDKGNRLRDRHFVPRLAEDGDEVTGDFSLHLHRNLVCLDLQKRLPGRDGVTDILEPPDDGSCFHCHARLGHDHAVGHSSSSPLT